MRSKHETGPACDPQLWVTIAVTLLNVSRNEIYVTVCSREGSVKQGKIRLFCRAGQGEQPLQLIWKESTGWVCWLSGEKYINVTIKPS